jgi:hypothetical protein
MTRSIFRIAAAVVFVLSALGAGALVLFPASWKTKKTQPERQNRIIIPQGLYTGTEEDDNAAELRAREASMTARAALGAGETIAAVLNGDFDGDPAEEQFVAYRNLLEIESPLYLTFIDYDEVSRGYRRLWSAPTAATRPGTISLYTLDLLGDRSVCVLLAGMNGHGEHTLTIFRKIPAPGQEGAQERSDLFNKIAELRIYGTIVVRETERSQAYQMGVAKGQSFTIAAYSRDAESSNLLDQVEIIYAYNTGNGLYEQRSRTRIPGSQIEQRRIRELLGNPRAFEDFITGLWYYVSPEGTIDSRQYIYFDPPSEELIFYGDETQQVFTWQNSSATRYGLYISSQNISVTTLRRSIDIELESLDSIRVRVFEDVRLKIGVNAPWNGSYRRAGPPENHAPKPQARGTAYISARYDGSIGKIHFSPDGTYELEAGGNPRQGKYAFFSLNDQELLELRSPGASGVQRETYLVEGDKSEEGKNRKTLTLFRVRLGARGIQRLHEGTISLTLTSE